MIELRIQFDPKTGRVNVTGPLAQEVLCLGLLAKAQRIVSDHAAGIAAGREQQANELVLPDGRPIPNLRG